MNDKLFHIANWTAIAYCLHKGCPEDWKLCDGYRPVDTIEEARKMMRDGKLLMALKRFESLGKTYLVVKSKNPVYWND